MKIIKRLKYHKLLYILLIPLFLITLSFLVILSYNLLYWKKIFPNIQIASISLSGKMPSEATEILKDRVTVPDKILIVYLNQTFEIPTKEINLSYDFQESASAAYFLFRTGNIFYDTSNKLDSMKTPINIGLRIQYDEKILDEYLSVIAGEVATDPIYPSAYYSNGELVVVKGRSGHNVDLDSLKLEVGSNLTYAKIDPIYVKTSTIDPSLTDEQVDDAKKRVISLDGKSIKLVFDEESFLFDHERIIELLSFPSGYEENKVAKLIDDVSISIDRDSQNAVFEFKDGKVQEFLPAKTGIRIKNEELKSSIMVSLGDLETSDKKQISILIPVEEEEPSITTEQVNNLGIKELIGKGESTFRGSISSRIYNINLASSRFNGTLIPPGETFSFNQALGDVSVYTGYKQAYIIKDGKTVLGDGGGVCQVSTTLFRAILDSGLPVLERRAHSYRVAYYEQGSPPGLDATVYSPTTDLKFENDTDNHILIQTQIDIPRSRLEFELYGTSDGRVSEISKPIVSDVTPPPEDLYVDDPLLPEGTIDQIDWKAWGAKVNFNYRVTKNESVYYEKTFYSNYRPWQSVYLRGTGPAN